MTTRTAAWLVAVLMGCRPILAGHSLGGEELSSVGSRHPEKVVGLQVAEIDKATEAQASAFEKGLPHARVVRIANAGHDVYRTNEADVLREMDSFIGALKP